MHGGRIVGVGGEKGKREVFGMGNTRRRSRQELEGVALLKAQVEELKRAVRRMEAASAINMVTPSSG